MQKKCPKCNTVKDLDEFYKNRTKKDGHTVYCKACISAYSKEYHSTHKEECRERLNKWRNENREYVRQRDRDYYKNTLDAQHAKDKRYRDSHPQERAEHNKNYRESHREYFHNKVRERRALKNSTSDGTITVEFESKLLLEQKGTCAYCGCDLSETGMHLDHIIPLSRGGTHTASNVHWVCPRCNLSKGNKLESEWEEYYE